MEQQEEKKIKLQGRKRRIQSSSMSQSNSSLPLDLVSEILLKLPAKSIVRSRCVSKLWSSITTDRYFIKTRYLPKPTLLMFFRNLDKLFVFSFPQYHQNSNQPHHSYSSQPLDRYQIKFPNILLYSRVESVHGLICFSNCGSLDQTPVIWNPSMRQFLTLPKPETSWRKCMIAFLGYDPIEGKHKVVCMSAGFSDECWVLTLGSSSAQESYWRRIKTNLYHQSFIGIYRCINGVLYYKAYLDHMQHKVVMSFDVRSEKFQPIALPVDDMCKLLIAYDRRLALVYTNYNGIGITIRVLEDAEKEEWSYKSFRAPFNHYDWSLETTFKLSGITDGGEFIYVPYPYHKSFCILYFDPKRDSFRKFEIEGISNDEFRLSNGLGNRSIYTLQAFPNHIESLISL